MMTLQEQLNAIKTKTAAMITPEVAAAMQKGFKELQGSNLLDKTLKVGDSAPDFVLPNGDGKLIDSETLRHQGPLVILFYRGKWWPYCNAELVALRQKYAEIQALGASLVAISPQLEHYNQELVKERRLPFEVLSDRGNQLAQAYKVAFALPDSMRWVYKDIFKLDLPTFNGDDTWTLPMPSRFIVDQQAVIRAADVNLDHTVRPEPDTAIEALKIIRK